MAATFYSTVIPLIEGKTILDAGSIGHSYSGRDGYKTWNFAVLAEHAAAIKGFDLMAEEVAEARRDGFDIDVGDAESYLADRPYDVVFAGDLIEHLSNPGRFLECSYQNLVPDGRLILSTPNTYSFAKLARVLARRTNEPPVNAEHTYYFTPQTLEELVSRHGFELARLEYCGLAYSPSHGSRWKRFELGINERLSSLAPKFSQSMIAVFSKRPG